VTFITPLLMKSVDLTTDGVAAIYDWLIVAVEVDGGVRPLVAGCTLCDFALRAVSSNNRELKA